MAAGGGGTLRGDHESSRGDKDKDTATCGKRRGDEAGREGATLAQWPSIHQASSLLQMLWVIVYLPTNFSSQAES